MALDNSISPVFRKTPLSPVSQRRLRLLADVLPPLSKAANTAYNNSKQFSSSRKTLTELNTPCARMGLGGWRFDRLDSQHEGLLDRSLQLLEQVVRTDDSEIDEALDSSRSPHLETIRKSIKSNPTSAEGQLGDRLLELSNGKTHEWRMEALKEALKEALDELAKALEDDSNLPLPEEASPTLRSKPLMAPFLHNIFSTLSKYSQCKCRSPHKAMLLLFTHLSAPENTDSHSFTMLLSRRKVKNQWQETGVTIKEQASKSIVRFEIPKSTSLQSDQESSIDPSALVTSLCQTIDTTAKSRLNLSVEGTALFKLPETGLEMKELEYGESVSLAEGLLDNDTELIMKGKICLALVLSYSLLDFSWEPWFPGGWTSKNICLLQHNGHVQLRPNVVTSTSRPPKESPPSSVSNDLKLLFHALLLIEIFNQAKCPMQICASKEIGELRKAVREQFDSVKWDVHENFRHSVEVCIEGGGFGLSSTRGDHLESFATVFCERVVAPLETEFGCLWGRQDPDQVLSKLKLPSVRHEPPLPAPKPMHLKIQREKPARPTTPKPSLGPSFPGGVNHFSVLSTVSPSEIKFFDASHSPDPKQVRGASQWFSNFGQAAIQARLPKKPREKDKRIKIAVLDTGIDMSNQWISQKIGSIQLWPPEDPCNDTDGHGTQVAYIILRLAPHAQLRIAKISDSQLLQDANVKKIAEAIEHFSSEKGDPVDVINLSFGFPGFHDQLQPILDAIRAARARKVLIFAAAGNDGGNMGISWPAKLCETGDVIRVNASDSDGYPSGFNPNFGSNSQIITLGEAVPSCESPITHRCGTSFATPIAVAVAAIVLGFMDGVDESRKPEDFETLKRRLRTKYGMEKVLCRTCVLQGYDTPTGVSYITPWFFLNIEEQSRVGIITNELRTVPE